MKVIGYKLDSEYKKGKVVNTEKFLMVVECCGLEIKKHSDEWFGNIHDDKNAYSVFIRFAHPTINYFIIGSKHRENGVYMWLTKEEAESLVEMLVNSDTIDLRELGDYQICSEGHIQTVMIMNDCDDFDGEPLPLLVKMSDND